MINAFTVQKMNDYVIETEQYILPLGELGKKRFPEYGDEIFTFKSHIESVLLAIKATIRLYNKERSNPDKDILNR